MLYIYYTLYSSHIILVSILYSTGGLLIFFFLASFCFFKNILTVSHSLWVYIVIDIFLYPYTLPIKNSFLSYQA